MLPAAADRSLDAGERDVSRVTPGASRTPGGRRTTPRRRWRLHELDAGSYRRRRRGGNRRRLLPEAADHHARGWRGDRLGLSAVLARLEPAAQRPDDPKGQEPGAHDHGQLEGGHPTAFQAEQADPPADGDDQHEGDPPVRVAAEDHRRPLPCRPRDARVCPTPTVDRRPIEGIRQHHPVDPQEDGLWTAAVNYWTHAAERPRRRGAATGRPSGRSS